MTWWQILIIVVVLAAAVIIGSLLGRALSRKWAFPFSRKNRVSDSGTFYTVIKEKQSKSLEDRPGNNVHNAAAGIPADIAETTRQELDIEIRKIRADALTEAEQAAGETAGRIQEKLETRIRKAETAAWAKARSHAVARTRSETKPAPVKVRIEADGTVVETSKQTAGNKANPKKNDNAQHKDEAASKVKEAQDRARQETARQETGRLEAERLAKEQGERLIREKAAAEAASKAKEAQDRASQETARQETARQETGRLEAERLAREQAERLSNQRTERTLPETGIRTSGGAVAERPAPPPGANVRTEVSTNLKIARAPWTGKPEPFRTTVWDNKYNNINSLPVEMQYELGEVYTDIRLANNIVWLVTEVGANGQEFEASYVELCNKIAERLIKISEHLNGD